MKSRVSEKGQVTIPKAVRDRLGIRPGTTLDFEAQGGRLVAVKVDESDAVTDVYGIWGGRGPRTDEYIAEIRGRDDE